MKPALNLRQTQRLAMTPQLQQAIRLLQMNTAELSAALMDAHETNPLLEMEEPEGREETLSVEEVVATEPSDDSRGTFDDDWVSQRITGPTTPASLRPDSGYDIPDRSLSATLHEHLEQQLSLMALEPVEKMLAEYLVSNLDDAGYLDGELDGILGEVQHEMEPGNSVSKKDLEHALTIVQALEPLGVGARTPGECLQLQLATIDPDTFGLSAARRIVDEFLHLLAERDYQGMRRGLRVDEDELREAIELIRHLSPHPGFSVGDVSVSYVTPDILVERRRGVWMGRLNTAALPKVMINRDYQQLVTENSSNASFSNLKEQLQDARWLLSNIEKRHDTILSVATQIIERQQSFFDHGPAAMRPMIMREIAGALDIHESTVSRAVNGKYMLTPLGLFELRYFFSTEVGSDNGTQSSSVAIQALIREMIEAEPPAKPISDMKICEALEKQGLEVARRTVAKYREQMNIPPSSKRKSL